jgi:hypothetical protein
MKAIITILIFLLIGVSLSCQTNRNNQLTIQELEVYKTILGKKPKEIVVIDELLVGVFGEISTGGLKKILRGLQNDTFDNFLRINSVPTKIERDFQTVFDYPLITKADFEKKDVKPAGYYVFSRVGFSNDGKQAVVMFIDVRNPLGIKGAYFLLADKNGFWGITEESESWRS